MSYRSPACFPGLAPALLLDVDVPEEEPKAVARQVADKIIGMLKEETPKEEAIHA
jgi:hypothetical protein